MGSTRNTPGSAEDRRARIQRMRASEQARERRNRLLFIGVSTLVVVGLTGGGGYLYLQKADEKEQTAAAEKEQAEKPVKDEKSWKAEELGRDHVSTPVSYPMTPPVGGDHNQVWMNCDGDVYEKPIPDVNAVHSLEHGAVWVTHNGDADPADVDKLTERVKSTPYSLMSPVEKQEGALMLSAWGKQVTVDSADDPRVAQFFTKYVQGPQTPEPGAACTGGLSS
ncbi:DUF3105 domain-containing protein [Streptomyces albidoflavus]